MAFDTDADGRRPRPWLLVVLGVAIVALVASRMWPSAAPTVLQSAVPRDGTSARSAQKPVLTGDLDVRLEALNVGRPEPGAAQRNPFRFQPRPEPPAPASAAMRPALQTAMPMAVAGPPPPPPIPLKFTGIVEGAGQKIATLSDCRSTYHGQEGAIVDGRYRLVRIGVESVIIEYVDGRGRTTLRSETCAPVR